MTASQGIDPWRHITNPAPLSHLTCSGGIKGGLILLGEVTLSRNSALLRTPTRMPARTAAHCRHTRQKRPAHRPPISNDFVGAASGSLTHDLLIHSLRMSLSLNASQRLS